jgi:hypothetical protein
MSARRETAQRTAYFPGRLRLSERQKRGGRGLWTSRPYCLELAVVGARITIATADSTDRVLAVE